jgi:preprotein translocase subunit YajC
MMLASVAFAAETPAAAAGAPPAGAAGMLGSFLPLIFLFVIFYFLLIRPQQRKAKETEKMIDALQRGDAVVTSAGIYGRIGRIDGEIVTLECNDKVRFKISKRSITGKVEPDTLEDKN